MSRPHRALPGSFVDLIHDGVPGLGDTYGAEYDRAVWKALNSTAVSAVQAGHGYAHWTYLLDQPGHRLGEQARRTGNRKHRSVSSYLKLITKVWDGAETFAAAHPIPTDKETTAAIEAVRGVAADGDADLTDRQRAVLTAACDLAQTHRTTRPALPLPELMARTGQTLDEVRSALRGLARRGLLTRERPGNARRRLAALYRLHPPPAPAVHIHPKTELCGQSTKNYVHIPGGTSAQGYVDMPPCADPNLRPDPEEPPLAVTVTITAPDPDALAAALDALRREQAVAVQPQPPQLAVLPGGRTDGAPRRHRPARDLTEPVPVPGQLSLPGADRGGAG
jgi:hypothetical protein